MIQDPPPSPPRGSSLPLAALSAAFHSARALLSGPDVRARWLRLAGLAVMAGLVGVGAPCPPFGLLQPAWAEPSARQSLLGNAWALGLALSLALFLLGMGGFGRSFTLAFYHALLTGRLESGVYRRFLRAGAAHYFWSGLLSVPLYLLLFALEWRASADNWARILAAAGGDVQPLVARWAVEVLLLQLGWTLITFPLMIWMYELTPAVMTLEGSGPTRASARALTLARKHAGAFAGYGALRLVIQLMGNSLGLLALAPAALLSAPLEGPLLALGWWLNRALGGWGAPGGAAAGTVAILLALAALYAALCAVLVPVSLLVNGLALHMVRLARER